MKYIYQIVIIVSIVLFSGIILGLSIRGIAGNPTEQQLNSKIWKEDGPFELSPERGRFALLYSVVENNSVQFTDEIGHFAQPDVGVYKGKYVSLFAPLLSLIVSPGYLIGKHFNVAQVGTFAVISLFAIINMLLIRLIAIKLGIRSIPATIAGFTFLFATPAYAYGVNLYQHHVSTFLILLSLYALIKSQKIWTLFIVFFLCGLAIPLDYPNLFLLFPIGVFGLTRIITVVNKKENMEVKIHLLRLVSVGIISIPIFFFLWFNKISYGNPLQLSGTIASAPVAKNVKDLETISAAKTIKKEASSTGRNAVGFFQTRNMINGFYEHLISPDRGILWFTPVMFFSIFGMMILHKKNATITALMLAVIGADILLYSMWGDPWGGWAFGSRYLIPAYAIMSIFIAAFLNEFSKKYVVLLLFAFILIYSVFVNTVGAITSSANPPKVEVLELEKLSHKVQKYTFERNIDFLKENNTKSFVWRTYLQNSITAVNYYFVIAGSISFVLLMLIIGLAIQKEKK